MAEQDAPAGPAPGDRVDPTPLAAHLGVERGRRPATRISRSRISIANVADADSVEDTRGMPKTRHQLQVQQPAGPAPREQRPAEPALRVGTRWGARPMRSSFMRAPVVGRRGNAAARARERMEDHCGTLWYYAPELVKGVPFLPVVEEVNS